MDAPTQGKFMSGPTGLLAAGGGGIGLFDPTSTRRDSMTWATLSAANMLTETTSCFNIPKDKSAARTPNGTDTDDNSKDFVVPSNRTPGAAN